MLARRYGDFDAAEDAVQEALLAAAVHWTRDGVPEQPYGWLITTGGRKLLDAKRSEKARRDREQAVAGEVAPEVPGTDDTLTVLFLCCHPSLTPASAVALTLRAVGGLTTAEIARAFLVPEATMAQRISRAKQKLRGARFDLPGDDHPDRLRVVLHVLYLIFNEGYAANSGDQVHRAELCTEAIRLVRLLPAEGETAGLLALMLLLDARRPARTGPGGELVALPDQDRSRWDQAEIAEGLALLAGAGEVGEYGLQALIAAEHDRAPTAAATDWPRILALYELLERRTGNPVVTVNRAVAAAMVHGPAAGLALLDEAEPRLPASHRVDAVRAHLLEQAGDTAGAAALYRAAAARATSVPERDHLTARAAHLRP